MSVQKQEIILAYRHLYQHLLRAVQYSRPARFVARERLRAAFRHPQATLDAARIANTLQFLDGAAKSTGLEHKIVKNLMHVWYERHKLETSPNPVTNRPDMITSRRKAYAHFDHALERLNETMGMCIK